MKVRWRQHEMIFETIVAVIMLGGYLWWIFHISNQQIDAGFAAPFKSNRLPFDFYRNLIFPHIGAGLLVYLSYLFINIFTIPRFLFPKKFEAGTAVVSLSLKKIAFQGMARKFIKEFSWLI